MTPGVPLPVRDLFSFPNTLGQNRGRQSQTPFYPPRESETKTHPQWLPVYYFSFPSPHIQIATASWDQLSFQGRLPTRVPRALGTPVGTLSVRLASPVFRDAGGSCRSLPCPCANTQKISSASGTLLLCSSSSRRTASVRSRSPSRRLSRVRMFTVFLLCSLWPTTAGRGEVWDSQAHSPTGDVALCWAGTEETQIFRRGDSRAQISFREGYI